MKRSPFVAMISLALLNGYPRAAELSVAVESAHREVWRRFIDGSGIFLDFADLDGKVSIPTPEECREGKPNALEKLAQQWPESPSPEDEKAVCQCVLRLLPELPAGDAELLRRVDLGGESPTEIAAAANERVNTLNVRLLRARRKLREQVERTCRACATHGCLDCDCA
jgi:hypothetical protein